MLKAKLYIQKYLNKSFFIIFFKIIKKNIDICIINKMHDISTHVFLYKIFVFICLNQTFWLFYTI